MGWGGWAVTSRALFEVPQRSKPNARPEQSSRPVDEYEGGDEEQTQSISQIPNSFRQFTSPWTTSAIARVYASLRGRRTIKIIFTLPRARAAARK